MNRPPSPVAAENFFSRVYDAVRRIPRGRVATYGQVALLLGVTRGARAVGWALRALRGRTATTVPWHRVLGASGRISLRGGSGPAEQRRRLEREGVRFQNGRIDLKRFGLRSAPDRQARPTRGSRRISRAR